MIKKQYDLMVLDKEDFPVIFVRVIRVDRFTDERRIFYFQQAHGYAKRLNADYVLVVSPFQMELWDSHTEKPVAMFDTATAFEPYSERWGPAEKLSRHGLESLTHLWLDRIIFWPNDDEVPYKEELRKLGVVEKLKYGIVRRKPEE
ncbi:hypothetical protein HYR99_06240 [Candidatus Poribacteria bacterium]|nr:hypothetical protein [Candidatus Poribacteria bacterium]